MTLHDPVRFTHRPTNAPPPVDRRLIDTRALFLRPALPSPDLHVHAVRRRSVWPWRRWWWTVTALPGTTVVASGWAFTEARAFDHGHTARDGGES